MGRRLSILLSGVVLGIAPLIVCADLVPPKGLVDPRVRVVPYDSEQVIRLHGFVGYQIDIQVAEGERLVRVASGDAKAIDVGSEANHIALKPLAERVSTNITILTNQRVYHFDYTASPRAPDMNRDEVIYSLRFIYPQDEARKAAEQLAQESTNRQLAAAADAPGRPKNTNYWFCGSPSIRPVSAFDDGVQTHLRFGARSEFPALFVKNEDGSESLLNFTVESDDVVIHRISRRLILRRGKLVGCVENRAFDGGGERLHSETLVPGVERRTKGGTTP